MNEKPMFGDSEVGDTIKNKETPEMELSRMLSDNGMEDSATIELFRRWIIQQQDRIEEINDPEEHRREQILLNFKQGEVYFEAGYIDEAFENFFETNNQLRCESTNENIWSKEQLNMWKELEEKIDKKIDEYSSPKIRQPIYKRK